MPFSFLPRRLRKYRLRTQLLVMTLPLALVPMALVGLAAGTLASRQAYLGVTTAARDDLDHMAHFTLDLFDAHYRQYEVYKEDKKRTVQRDLAALVNVAEEMVQAQAEQSRRAGVPLADAKRRAIQALKDVSVGQSGYLYAMTSRGRLVAHVAREGESIYDERDESGRYFIREMCKAALASKQGEVLTINYPWKNPVLGDVYPREKTVAYRYFAPWDWIIAAGTYLDETYEDRGAELRAFEEIRAQVKAKRVGRTGYIYVLDNKGNAVIHPAREGQNLYDETDHEGRYFIREMVARKEGWIHYPWRNETDPAPRMKIVRYLHFEPWDWIVAVGSYENEFLHDAEAIQGQVTRTTLFLVLGVGVFALLLVVVASRVFTLPITHMTDVLRRVRGGELDEKMTAEGSDELAELADAYNRMGEKLKAHRELEANLAQQGKMASLGVLSSGIAHELNNPLGVILGYAAYLENKLPEDDPNRPYIEEIKRESKRSKKIVQDLLSYARAPRPAFSPVALNALLHRIVDFILLQSDLSAVRIERDFDPELPPVEADGDQIQQVAVNLLLNAAAAVEGGGSVTLSTRRAGEGYVEIVVADTGEGMAEEVRSRIFEPFFTTKGRGTGLGLSITRQIVERHQGVIEVESEPGRGATVTVRLPVRHEEF